MKIRKSDLPSKNYALDNYLRCLTNAIKNERTGNYNDCNLQNEETFKIFLDALEKAGLIKQNKELIDHVNLSNYCFVNNNVNITIKNFTYNKKTNNWFYTYVIPLLPIGIELLKLFIKI